MFQTFAYIRYENGKDVYRLVDSDFVAIGAVSVRYGMDVTAAASIAKEYEQRNLNVPANLALYYRWLQEHNRCSFDYIVEQNFKRYPELSKEFYGKYHNDIKRYMMLV